MTRGSSSDSETKELLGAEMQSHGEETRQIILRCNAQTIACVFFTWIVTALFLNYFISALRHPPDIHGLEIRGGEFCWSLPIVFGIEKSVTNAWTLVPAYQWIEKEIKTFTGTAIFLDGDIAYREHVPGVKEYIDDGPDSERNWDTLVKGRYFYISEEEARSQWPDTYLEWYHDEWGWIIGFVWLCEFVRSSSTTLTEDLRLDVFHTLHCVVS